MENPSANSFDLVIAGGGLAGLLAAIRFADGNRNARIALVEKAPSLGGRLRNDWAGEAGANYGLDTISPRLFDFCNATLRLDPESPDLSELGTHSQEFGVMISGKIRTTALSNVPTSQGARLLGGLAASKDWRDLRELAGPQKEDHSETHERAGAHAFQASWPHPKKAAASVALQSLASAMGIPDPWSASSVAISERASLLASSSFRARWTPVFAPCLQRLQDQGILTVLTSSPIVAAKRAGDTWTLMTQRGEMKAKRLMIAQSPWEATSWLAREECPAQVLSLSSKTKPVSSVVLTQKISRPAELPDFLLIPSEDVLAVTQGDELCLRTTIDFELSLQAPAVIKAVRQLKRAKKKIQQAFPEMTMAGEHLALLPVTWTQPVSHSEKRWLDKFDRAKINSPYLSFCGDAYGHSFDYDDNLIHSVIDACEAASHSP